MQRYNDPRGNSAVTAYEAGPNYIDVQFRDGPCYRYTYQVPGAQHVEAMKQLASEGQKLATYINQHVRNTTPRLSAPVVLELCSLGTATFPVSTIVPLSIIEAP